MRKKKHNFDKTSLLVLEYLASVALSEAALHKDRQKAAETYLAYTRLKPQPPVREIVIPTLATTADLLAQLANEPEPIDVTPLYVSDGRKDD